MQNLELLSFASADELARAAASAWLDEIEAANRAGKLHCVALSGGRITQKFFAATVEQGKVRGVSFERVHFFWADERCLPPTDPESNFKMANELLFTPLNIAAEKIHRLRGEDAPAVAVKIAEAELRRVIQPEVSSPSPPPKEERAGERRPMVSDPLTPTLSPFGRGEGVDSLPRLDLVLLGMGEDGHVASLFPNAGPEILNCAAPFLAVGNSPKPPPTRISLSYQAIADARQVWALVSGAAKADALRETLKPEGTTPLARVIRSRPVKILSDLAGF
jgi:6-phosphogluconolactonase